MKQGKVSAYLATVARNSAKNRIRSYRQTLDIDDMLSLSAEEDVEDAIAESC